MILGLTALVLTMPAAADVDERPHGPPALDARLEQPRWTTLEVMSNHRAREAGERRAQAARLRTSSPRHAIRAVFGRDAEEALTVARCESRLSVQARNGQYLGLFQMGEFARSRYGHGQTAYQQARAAHRYFVDSGRSWDPWSCEPW